MHNNGSKQWRRINQITATGVEAELDTHLREVTPWTNLHKPKFIHDPDLHQITPNLYCSQRFTQTNVKFKLVLNTDLATRPQGKLKDLKNGWGAVKFCILSDFMDFSLCICNWAWEICRQYFSGASLQEPSLWLVKWKYCSIESKQMHHLQIEEG